MVKEFYAAQGFEKIKEETGKTVWRFEITKEYKKKNCYIEVKEKI